MSRIFSVRINLDTMAAQLDAYDGDVEVAQWMAGFRVGSRGGSARDGWTMPKAQGHAFGLAAYKEAAAMVAEQSKKGLLSAAKRRERWGSAQPRKTLPPEPVTEPRIEPVSEPSPNLSNNPVIQESKNRVIEITRPDRTNPSSDIMDGMDGEETPIELAQAAPMEVSWQDWRFNHPLVRVAFRGEDGCVADWQRLFDGYTIRSLDTMYARLQEAKPGAKIYYSDALAWLESKTPKAKAQ